MEHPFVVGQCRVTCANIGLPSQIVVHGPHGDVIVTGLRPKCAYIYIYVISVNSEFKILAQFVIGLSSACMRMWSSNS